MIPAVSVKNLICTYPDGIRALNDVSFEIFEGEKAFIIGPNGAGKSTLFNCLLGFLNFSGSIHIKGISLNKENLRKIREIVGIVFQDPDDQILMPTVIEDVLFGARNKFEESLAQKFAGEAMLTAGLSGFENRLAHHLSFGEKKRVAIAGVLAMKPEIILLDEPTSNLDHKHRMHLISTLEKIKSTLIVATHDMKLVCQLATRVIVLNQGKIIADGKPEAILNDRELLQKAYLDAPCSCELELLFSRIK